MLPCEPLLGGAVGDCRRECRPRRRWVDDLVYDAQVERPIDSAGDPFVLGRQLQFELRAGELVVHLGEVAPMQDAHRRNRAHDRDLGARPGEDAGGAKRTRVHGDIGAAVRLASHQRHPRHGGLGERVQQLRSATHDTVPLLTHAGQVAGDVDDHDERDTERIAHPHEARGLLRGGRVEAATEAQRVVGNQTHGPSRKPTQGRHDVGRPTRVELDAAVLVEQAGDQRMDVVRAFRAVRQSVSARSTSLGSPMSP